MGKKSDKIEAAKAKVKEIKAPKLAKPVAEVVEVVKEAKPVLKSGKVKATSEPVEISKVKPEALAVPADPTFEEIQVEAYHIAQKRIADGISGTSAEDWVAAEKALRKSRGL